MKMILEEAIFCEDCLSCGGCLYRFLFGEFLEVKKGEMLVLMDVYIET